MRPLSTLLALLCVPCVNLAYAQRATTDVQASDTRNAISAAVLNAPPRNQRRVVLSAQATPERYRAYVQEWAKRIEAASRQDYPQINAVRRNGATVLTVGLGPEGQLLSVAVARTSGIAALDAAAIKAVAQAAPIAAFPDEIRRDTDVLMINRELSFSTDSRLVVGAVAPAADASAGAVRHLISQAHASQGCAVPKYPQESAYANESGAVLLAFKLSVDGAVIESMIQRSSGYSRLDAAALEALSQCTFRPLLSEGVPREGWALLEFKWVLE